MSNKTIKCENCDGTGTILITGFICGANAPDAVVDHPMSCLDCSGRGKIDEWTLKMRRIGQYVRLRRIEMDLSLREQSHILGMSAGDFNDLMRGRK